jgi:hypothetical protein
MFTRHPNDKSPQRIARSERAEVRGVKPHTPNRKCVKQEIKGGKVYYLHVTRGPKVRTLTPDVSIEPMIAAIRRAQKHQQSVA